MRLSDGSIGESLTSVSVQFEFLSRTLFAQANSSKTQRELTLGLRYLFRGKILGVILTQYFSLAETCFDILYHSHGEKLSKKIHAQYKCF